MCAFNQELDLRTGINMINQIFSFRLTTYNHKQLQCVVEKQQTTILRLFTFFSEAILLYPIKQFSSHQQFIYYQLIQMESSILKNVYNQISIYTLETNQHQFDKRQSGIAIIFRINPKYFIMPEQQFQNSFQFLDYAERIEKTIDKKKDAQGFFQILFLQRSINKKDQNSGQICFPGGKCDDNQNDLQAAIRQTFQQTNIKLNRCHILGKIKRNFYVRETKKQKLFTSSYVFLLQQPNIQIKLNQSQIMDFNWFPFKNILYNTELMRYLNLPTLHYLLNLSKAQVTKIASKQQILNNFEFISWPSLYVGMNFDLFGLSFYILIQLMHVILHTSINILRQEKIEQYVDKLIKHGYFLDISFKKQFKQADKIRQIIRNSYLKQRYLIIYSKL